MEKIKYKDPFLGEIELTKHGETSMHLLGESRVDSIYLDERENLYIDTWITTGGDKEPMMYLRKDLVDKIVEIYNSLKK